MLATGVAKVVKSSGLNLNYDHTYYKLKNRKKKKKSTDELI